MKWPRFILVAAALFFAGIDLPSIAAPNQLVPKGLGDTITLPGLLSYQAPAGWNQVETNASPQACGPISNGVVPDITFNPGNYGPLSKLADTFELTYYDDHSVSLKQVDQKSFVTSAGVKAVRVHAINASSGITQYSYVFLSSDGQQLELACACATADAAVYLPVFDASMKSVKILKPE